jgi:hypothetical protein
LRALWLSCSLARGTADAASDLDLLLAVADDALDDFAATWRDWLGDITPTVLAEALPFAKASFYSVTPGFERLDVVTEPVSVLPMTFFRRRTPVFDKDGLHERIPPPDPGPGPSRDAVAAMITEYFRISAIETVIVRQDWLLAREHLHLVGSLSYRLFTEANAPLPPMGVKQWSTKLTDAQQAALAALPTDATTVEEFRAAHVALAEVFVTNAEALATRLGIDWPTDLEAAAAAHLRRHLTLDDPYPRTAAALVI